MEYKHHKKITGRVCTSGQSNSLIKCINDEGYVNLLVAIYQRAILDVYEADHVNHNKLNWETVVMNGADALNFLKKNPYDMDIDYKSILAHMEKNDFVGKGIYKKNDCWNV